MKVKESLSCRCRFGAYAFGIFILLTHSILFLQAASLTSEQVQERIRLFDYPADHQIISLERKRDWGWHLFWKGTISLSSPVTKKKITADFSYYPVGDKNTPSPLVIILPSMLGVGPVESHMARYFGRKGISTLLVDLNGELTDPKNSIDKIDPNLRESMGRFRSLVDWALTRQEIDKNKISVLGVSLGGILGALFLGIEPRLNSGTFFAAGAPLSKIFAFGRERLVSKFRLNCMQKHKLESPEKFQEFLDRNVLLDPIHFLSHRSAEDVFLISARYDQIVPAETQDDLWEAFGRPLRRTVHGGHLVGVGSFIFYLGEVTEFFRERWDQ